MEITFKKAWLFLAVLFLLLLPLLVKLKGVTSKTQPKEVTSPIIYSVDNQDSYVIGTVESKYRFDEDNYIMILDGGRMYKITFQQYEQIETGDKVFSYVKKASEE